MHSPSKAAMAALVVTVAASFLFAGFAHDAGDGFAIFVALVSVEVGVVGLGQDVGLRRGFGRYDAVVGALGGRSDANPELYLLSEAAAERVGDGGAQVTFDLVLHEAARDRQQSKPLHDGEWLNEVQPGSLLGGERIIESRPIGGDAVRGDLAIEFGNDRIPHCGET